MVAQKAGLFQVSKSNPCPHCGKPDWCYFLGDEISVCNRKQPPGTGWEDVGKFDKEGAPMYVRQREKPTYSGEKKTTYYPYCLRDGSQNLRVRRIDIPGKEKDIKPEHLNAESGEWKTGFGPYNRPDIRIYRYEEAREAIEAGLPIIICEGEGKVDALREKGLAACCNIGGSKKWRKTDTMDLVGAKEIYIAPDCDKPGIEHAKLLLKEFPQAKFLLPFKDSPRWENIPEKHGIDIKNYLEDYPSLTGDEIIEKLSTDPAEAPFLKGFELLEFIANEAIRKERNYEDGEPREATKIYTQKALDELFTGHWIAISGELYKWNGTHYEKEKEPDIRRRIAAWLNEYAEHTPKGLKYSRASKKAVSEILGWAIDNFSVSPDGINPAGLNFRNGVLQFSWEGRKALWELLPHDPARHYIYCSDIEYDPQADKVDCDKLLSCLPPPQRKIFLQTIAASLDIPTIRKHRSRMVRLLIAYGSGSNGKDTLREAIAAIFGSGMTTATLSDFQAYDQGRKFPLAKLENSRINWPSENSQFAVLDNIQSIKLFATGDPLSIERKNQDEYSYSPQAIGIFNCNKLPIIKAVDEAIRSRWAFLEFPYTFKTDADPSLGEIEADPRFRYDPDFLKNKVAPALLNEILSALETLLEEGINYESCTKTLEEAQKESCHLRLFAEDVGLVEMPGHKVYIGDLWEKLRGWYLEKEIIQKEEGRERLLWSDFGNSYDQPVKNSNQVSARFREVFKCSYGKEYADRERRGQAFLSGICFAGSTNLTSQCEAVDKPVSRQFSLILRGCEADKPVLGEVVQFLLKNFSEDERAEICKAICKCENHALQEVQPISAPEPIPTPQLKITEKDVAGTADVLRDAIAQNNWGLAQDMMEGVSEELKQAAWSRLDKVEREKIHNLKKSAEPTPTPQPEPTPQKPPLLPIANRVGDRVRYLKSGKIGTITHIYEDKKGNLNKAMVEFKEKGEEPKSEILEIKKLDLFHRAPKFEKPKKIESRPCRLGLIHRFEIWEPGQIVVTQKGRKIGRIIKGCSGGVVVKTPEGEEKKLLFSGEIELMNYQRIWELGEGWKDGYPIFDIPGKNGKYDALLVRKYDQWYCAIYDEKEELKIEYVGREPHIWKYEKAVDWMEECVDSFLKRE